MLVEASDGEETHRDFEAAYCGALPLPSKYLRRGRSMPGEEGAALRSLSLDLPEQGFVGLFLEELYI